MEKVITRSIESRMQKVVNNQRSLINSLLERTYRNITVDYLLITDPITKKSTLLTEPEDVLRAANTQFPALRTKRKHQFDNLPDAWISTYSPIASINDQWYDGLMNLPSEEEWRRALQQSKLNTVPEISGISYRLIKHAF